MFIAPIHLELVKDKPEHSFSIGVSLDNKAITKELDEYDPVSGNIRLSIIAFAIAIIMIVVVSGFVSLELSHQIIKPIRVLNAKISKVIE